MIYAKKKNTKNLLYGTVKWQVLHGDKTLFNMTI